MASPEPRPPVRVLVVDDHELFAAALRMYLSRDDRIRVVNTGGRTGTAYLYAVDATTGQTSGAVYLSRQSPKRDVGAWIRLSQSNVTLAPGKNAVVDYTIRIPATVRPGDHLGGIVAENSQVQQ